MNSFLFRTNEFILKWQFRARKKKFSLAVWNQRRFHFTSSVEHSLIMNELGVGSSAVFICSMCIHKRRKTKLRVNILKKERSIRIFDILLYSSKENKEKHLSQRFENQRWLNGGRWTKKVWNSFVRTKRLTIKVQINFVTADGKKKRISFRFDSVLFKLKMNSIFEQNLGEKIVVFLGRSGSGNANVFSANFDQRQRNSFKGKRVSSIYFRIPLNRSEIRFVRRRIVFNVKISII